MAVLAVKEQGRLKYFDMEKNNIIKISKYPNDDDDDWVESNYVCPKCKNKLLWIREWWDDPIELGGACIGHFLNCGDCNYTTDI